MQVAPIVSTGWRPARPHSPSMQKPIAKAIRYYVIATNPAGWQSVYIDVRATSRVRAEEAALRELARTGKGDWTVEVVVEQEAA